MARTLDIENEVMNEKKEQAERMLLSCLLQDLSLETPLLESDFSTPKNKFYFKLITELAPRYKDRNGGYTRIIKKSERKGDSALEVILELV